MLLEPPLEPILSSRSLNACILGLATLLAPMLLAGCDRQSGQQAQPSAGDSAAAPELPAGSIDRTHKGSPLPKLVFTGKAGAQLQLGEQHGPLLVNLWATWCAPCVAELPTLHKLAAAQTGKITVIAVSEDFGDPGKVSAFWNAKGLADWPLWLDPQNQAASQYQANTLPTTIYYDAKGLELWRFTGGRDWTSKETAALLAEAGK